MSCGQHTLNSHTDLWTPVHMMTSSNGNIFRVTGHLCGEFTGPRWIPHTKASDAELWCFLWSAPWINGWVNNREAGDLRRYCTHYDVTVMILLQQLKFPIMGYKSCCHDTASSKLAVFASKNKQVVQIRIEVSPVEAVSILAEFDQNGEGILVRHCSGKGIFISQDRAQCSISKCVLKFKTHIASTTTSASPVGPRWAPCWPHESCYLGIDLAAPVRTVQLPPFSLI